MFDTLGMLEDGTMTVQAYTSVMMRVDYDAHMTEVWAQLTDTARATFALTNADGTLYTLDGIELDWDSVDCGHATENELCN